MRARVSGAGSRLAVIGVLAMLAAGCASGGPGSAPPLSPKQAVEMAATTATKVNSLAVTISVHMASAAGSSLGTGALTMTGTVAEQLHPSLLAKVDYTKFDVSGLPLSGGMSEIVTTKEVYLRLAEFSKLLHTGKPWIGMSLSAMSAGTGLNLSGLFNQLNTSSPLSQTRLFAAAKNVKKVGTGTVAGVSVTEYTGTFSMSTALSKLPASVRSSFGKAFKQTGLDSGSAHFKVWIDGQHQVRKSQATITGKQLTETVSSTVTSINQPVHVTAPPASQVYQLSASQLGSAVGG